MRKLKLVLPLFFILCGKNIVANANGKIGKHELVGKASYYGSEYKKERYTANGESFNKNSYTAAHKTLPFGTIVKVKNMKNKKVVKVRINDRGPFAKGRIIDITPVAAKDLAMIESGVAQVELEIVSLPKK